MKIALKFLIINRKTELTDNIYLLSFYFLMKYVPRPASPDFPILFVLSVFMFFPKATVYFRGDYWGKV